MAIDFAHYEGREQAFVKHTFLDKYLPALTGKVCSKYDEFVYVDGFAGPWKSVAGQSFDDTSFGIALDHMTAQRLLYLGRGRDVKMRAFLVERDAVAFSQLQKAVERFDKIEVIPLKGKMEDHAVSIAASIPSPAFSFTLIDPKGFPAIEAMIPLLKRQNSEALVNFMFDFANRFAGTDLIPRLEAWLSALGSRDWQNQVSGLSGPAREEKLEELAADALRITGDYAYAPVITVDKAVHDRALYKLIFLSRHPEGLKVFRDSQAQALIAQADSRSRAKARKRAASATIGDLFAEGEDAIPNDRSSQILKRSEAQAPLSLERALTNAGREGVLWRDLWPPILNEYAVTRSWLGRDVNARRKSGRLLAPNWPSERHRIPDDQQRLIWAVR